jgi:predicted nucleic acid-binding protein
VSDALVYLDSSAVIKLIFEEPETPALEQFLAAWPNRVSSVLAQLEVLRVARSVEDAAVTQHAHDVLARIHLIRLDDAMRAAAAEIESPALRTLDAIHLATALSLGAELAGIVVYDRRLAGAARRAALAVWTPA